MRVPVAFGVTETVPAVVVVERLRLLPERSIDDAFKAFHERTEEEPRTILVEDAEKELMVGEFCTFTVIDAVDVLFNVSVAKAQRVVDPFATETVLHGTEYNVPAAVEVDPTSVLEARLAPKDPS